MKSSEIREKFLKFFEGKEHKILPGSSLVPKDPTVLLTLAGMLQFKPIFLGQEKPAFRRVTTVQRCMRMVDIDKVGKTPRHHTFFEMLGNFSFGDYFKKEAILFAWELLTREFKIPVTKLKVAVFEKDEEAYQIWRESIGLPSEVIFKLGEENNFWSAGPTGPCGPCSEIYFDLGEEKGCGKPTCAPGCDCDRYLELWNLVFIEYNRNEKGELLFLKQKGIDTGMGLERIASVLQGVEDNFETDLFTPLIRRIEALSKNESKISTRIIADHLRAITNLVADGVYPENTGRGYVLRRLIRRAVHHGKLLGIEKPFLYELVSEVTNFMKDAYPFLKEKEKEIIGVTKEEEESFLTTLALGMKYFKELMAKHQTDKLINGKEAFKLHDTYGFPIELTQELAEELGYQIEIEGFNQEMEKQRTQARLAQLTGREKDLSLLDLSGFKPTEFVGYEKYELETKVIEVFKEHNFVILEKTPFYGESGGQVGDKGVLSWDHKEANVIDTYLSPQGIILHKVDNLLDLKKGTKVKARIDLSRRLATAAHHTATHLLHRALREVLGEHALQRGSYVGPDKLRFDFTHFHRLSNEELQKVEQIVNQKIKEKLKVEVLEKSYEDAMKMGAMALFGEKYGKKVRVLKIGNYSLELCGGTHVKSTADILFFKIISENALGAGVRRIEALAGQAAKVFIVYRAKSLYEEVEALIKKYRNLQEEKEKLGGKKTIETNIFEVEFTELERIAQAVDHQDSVNVNKFLDHLCGRVEWLKERVTKAEKEIESLKQDKIKAAGQELLAEVELIGNKKVLFKEFKDYTLENLRVLSDSLQAKLSSCVLVLASVKEDKVLFLITVTSDLVAQGISAKNLAAKFAQAISGRGGGKDHKAEGGGKDPAGIHKGFEAVKKEIE